MNVLYLSDDSFCFLDRSKIPVFACLKTARFLNIYLPPGNAAVSGRICVEQGIYQSKSIKYIPFSSFSASASAVKYFLQNNFSEPRQFSRNPFALK
jgi:hypothetical protein